MTSTPDCSALTDLDAFPKYIATLRNETAFNLALLTDCKKDICDAVFGVGNPDVSGVGVSKEVLWEQGWNTK